MACRVWAKVVCVTKSLYGRARVPNDLYIRVWRMRIVRKLTISSLRMINYIILMYIICFFFSIHVYYYNNIIYIHIQMCVCMYTTRRAAHKSLKDLPVWRQPMRPRKSRKEYVSLPTATGCRLYRSVSLSSSPLSSCCFACVHRRPRDTV